MSAAFDDPRARHAASVLCGARIAGGRALSAQVCVIGTGAGGAVAAAECAERGLDVVMVEAGPWLTSADFTRRAFEMVPRAYRNLGMTLAMGGVGLGGLRPGIPIPLGRAVGGTTVINSGTCFRTPLSVLERWRDHHRLTGFTEETMAPLFARVERLATVRVPDEGIQGRNGWTFARGARSLGWTVKPLARNASSACKGSGVCCFGCPEDAKQSMALTYVPRALEFGARLVTECLAQRFLSRGGRVKSLCCRLGARNGRREEARTLTIEAERFIVACGALDTPVLLSANGLGRRGGHLGRHLFIHPCTKVHALFDEAIDGHLGVPQGFYVEDFKREGITLEGIFMPPEPTAISLNLAGAEHQRLMARYRHLASFGIMTLDASEGRVSRLPGGAPLIRYPFTREAFRRVAKGIRLAAQAFFAAGARSVYMPSARVPVLEHPRDLARIDGDRLPINDLDLMAFHPMGTARMATDWRYGVTDDQGRVFGVDNLFIADASLMPTPLNVNPQETIWALATRVADRVAQSLKP